MFLYIHVFLNCYAFFFVLTMVEFDNKKNVRVFLFDGKSKT